MCYPLFLAVVVKPGAEPGMTHLDTGCGAGRASYLSSKMGAGVCGLDASAALVTTVKQRNPEGDFRVGEMENFRLETHHSIL